MKKLIIYLIFFLILGSYCYGYKIKGEDLEYNIKPDYFDYSRLGLGFTKDGFLPYTVTIYDFTNESIRDYIYSLPNIERESVIKKIELEKNISREMVTGTGSYRIDVYFPTKSFFFALPNMKIIVKKRLYDHEYNYTFYWNYWCIFGNNIATPAHDAIWHYGNRLDTFIVHLPEDARIIKFGGINEKNLLIDNNTILFYRSNLPTVVYYQPNQKFKVQIILIGVFVLFTALVIVYHDRIPRFAFKSKHLLFAFLIISILMIQMAFVFHSPKDIVVSHGTDLNFGNKNQIVLEPQGYLHEALGLTNSIDAYVLGSSNMCRRLKHTFLTLKSVDKYFIIEEDSNKNCTTLMPIEYKSSWDKGIINIIKRADLNRKLNEINHNNYPLGFMYQISAKFISILSFLIIFVALGFLFLKAFEIKKWQFFLLIPIGLGLIWSAMITYTVTGFNFHMPVAYHGLHPQGVTINSYFFPSLVKGGNNVRNIFGILGILFVVLFSANLKNRLDIRLVFLPIIIYLFMLVWPATEYNQKRDVLTNIAEEADVYDQMITMTFSPKEYYTALRMGGFSQANRYACSTELKYNDFYATILKCPEEEMDVLN